MKGSGLSSSVTCINAKINILWDKGTASEENVATAQEPYCFTLFKDSFCSLKTNHHLMVVKETLYSKVIMAWSELPWFGVHYPT